MTSRKKATRDLKIEQGKRRDAYFDRLKRTAQSRAATAAKKPEPQAAQ
jgi:hypothetical protein